MICGPDSQTVSLASSSALEVETAKNQVGDVVTLIDAATVQGLFEVADGARCPVTEYVLLDANGDEIVSGDDLFTRFDIANRGTDAVSIDTTADTDGTVAEIPYVFQIKAIADGGAFVIKDVNSKIIVCGTETLTLVNSVDLSTSLVVRANVSD